MTDVTALNAAADGLVAAYEALLQRQGELLGVSLKHVRAEYGPDDARFVELSAARATAEQRVKAAEAAVAAAWADLDNAIAALSQPLSAEARAELLAWGKAQRPKEDETAGALSMRHPDEERP